MSDRLAWVCEHKYPREHRVGDRQFCPGPTLTDTPAFQEVRDGKLICRVYTVIQVEEAPNE